MDTHAKADVADPDRIESRDDFRRAVLAAVQAAGEAGRPELWFCDPDFRAWPLSQPALVDALTRWTGPRRRLELLAAHYQELPRHHARWVNWRVQWSHLVHCRAVEEEMAGRVPTLLLVPGLVAVRLHDQERYRGRVVRDPAGLRHEQEELDALAQRAREDFPVTTLGL